MLPHIRVMKPINMRLSRMVSMMVEGTAALSIGAKQQHNYQHLHMLKRVLSERLIWRQPRKPDHSMADQLQAEKRLPRSKVGIMLQLIASYQYSLSSIPRYCLQIFA